MAAPRASRGGGARIFMASHAGGAPSSAAGARKEGGGGGGGAGAHHRHLRAKQAARASVSSAVAPPYFSPLIFYGKLLTHHLHVELLSIACMYSAEGALHQRLSRKFAAHRRSHVPARSVGRSRRACRSMRRSRMPACTRCPMRCSSVASARKRTLAPALSAARVSR